MKKTTKRFLSFLAAGVVALQSAAFTPVFAEDGATNEIAMYKPVLDGKMDAAYGQSLSVSLNKDLMRNSRTGGNITSALQSKYTGNADATAYYLWSGNYLYIYAEITDSTVDALEGDIANPVLNNNVFFTVWDGAAWPGASAEILANASNGYVYTTNTTGTLATNISAEYATATAATEYAVTVTSGVGYTVEMRVDLGELAEGDEWSLALSVNDWTTSNFSFWRFGYMYTKDAENIDVTAKLGGKVHVFSDEYTVDVKAKCLTEGSQSRHCLEEGCTEVTDVTVIPANGHFEMNLSGRPATCTMTGLTAGKMCLNCGVTTVAQEAIPLAEHTPVTDAAVDATCTSTGLTEGSHCDVCQAVITAQEEVPMLEHTPVTDAALDATCTSTGLTEGSHCDVCDTVLVAQEETPVIDHNWVESIIQDATCTEAGSKQLVCDGGCGSVDPEVIVIDPKGHIDEDSDYACDVCGETLHTPGDITGDGKVDSKDLTRLMKLLSGAKDVVAYGPDVTGDGEVDTKDLTRLMKYLAGNKDVTLH